MPALCKLEHKKRGKLKHLRPSLLNKIPFCKLGLGFIELVKLRTLAVGGNELVQSFNGVRIGELAGEEHCFIHPPKTQPLASDRLSPHVIELSLLLCAEQDAVRAYL